MDSDDEYEYETEEEYNDGENDDDEMLPSQNDDMNGDAAGTMMKISAGTFDMKSYQKPGYKLKIPDGEYFISEYSAIAPIMESLVAEVASLLDLDCDAAQTLLQYCKWSKERLMDQFFTASEKLLLDAGLDMYIPVVIKPAAAASKVLQSPSSVSVETHSSPTKTVTSSATATATAGRVGGAVSSSSDPLSSLLAKQSNDATNAFTCRICCELCQLSDSFSLGCGHMFCRTCYAGYLRSQVNDGPACVHAHCPQHKCKQRVTRSVYSMLLADSHAEHDRYKIFILRNFVEMTKGMQYCPAPGCDKVAVGTGVCTVRCSCGSVFCAKCGDEAHEPCTCAQLQDWAKKCMNESETANWILANTKKCPKCNARIEKNQGCNHMNCKLCKYEFCWICMGEWSEHSQQTGGYYKCNRYEGGMDPSASAAQKAKAELDRYLHYYQRYHGHDQALKYAASRRAGAEARMAAQQEHTRVAWIDVQFLRQAVEQVVDCRRVLKYTYALGYFLTDGSPEKHLFEHQQEMLEKNTERLHEFTEQPLDSLDRTQVVNLTRVTERFMSELLTTTEGGLVDTSAAMMLSSSPAALSYMSASPGTSLGAGMPSGMAMNGAMPADSKMQTDLSGAAPPVPPSAGRSSSSSSLPPTGPSNNTRSAHRQLQQHSQKTKSK